jgi:hypothetical protein
MGFLAFLHANYAAGSGCSAEIKIMPHIFGRQCHQSFQHHPSFLQPMPAFLPSPNVATPPLQGVLEVLFFEPYTQLMLDELAPPQPTNATAMGLVQPVVAVGVGGKARQALTAEMEELLVRLQE